MKSLVHVIDDDDAVRDALAAFLDVRGLEVRTYESAQQFLDRLPEADCGCVVTDVQMPEMTGLDLLRRMEGKLGEFPVIVLTGKADVAMAVAALKCGASDFIEKPIDGDVVCAAVEAALQRAAGSAALARSKEECLRRLAALSPRERDVLRGIVMGQSNKEVARDLGISPRTVEAYRANLMMKMQAESLSELIRMSLFAEPTP